MRFTSLPQGWASERLGALLPLAYGKGLTEDRRQSEGAIAVFGSSGIVGHHNQSLVDGPALVIGRKGNVGSVFLSEVACWPIDTVYFAQVGSVMAPRFALHLLRFLNLGRLDRSTAVPGLSRDDYNAVSAPLPPRAEQDRIVAAIEEHLSDVDAGVAALERVLVNLKRYRAAVLKAACEGRLVLTEAELARREGRSYEPADVLLRPILAERCESQDRPAAPKASLKDVGAEEAVLPSIPPGWCWTTLRKIAELKGGITKGQKRKLGDRLVAVPYLRVANVQRGALDLLEMKEIEATQEEIEDLRLKTGDVLFNEGGDRDKLGRGWVWNDELPLCIHQNHVFRARLSHGLVLSKFVSWYGNSFGQKYFVDQGKQTTNLASINKTKLGALPVPIPPLAEQRRIVAEAERLLSVVDETERATRTQLARAASLRQSVLKRAFEGKLVPQDPADEPASVLLERIRGAQSTAVVPSASPRPRRKTA